jgi:large subunit ribosomal protein L24
MKKQYSSKWKGSRQVRKQRKYRANAPLNEKHKMISSTLSDELRKKYQKRSFPLRKGDSVEIMRGEYAKKTGKVNRIKLSNLKVTIEGVQETKKDGTKRDISFDPSNLRIKELNLDDKRRKEAIERKITNKEKAGKAAEEKK